MAVFFFFSLMHTYKNMHVSEWVWPSLALRQYLVIKQKSGERLLACLSDLQNRPRCHCNADVNSDYYFQKQLFWMSLRYLQIDSCDSSKGVIVLVNCRNKGLEHKYLNRHILSMNIIFKLFPQFQICTNHSLLTSPDLWCHPIRMDVSTGVLQNVQL